MKNFLGYIITVFVLIFCPIQLFGCTATSVIEAGHNMKDSNTLAGARQAAADMIAEEDLLDIEATVDAGAGTLIAEAFVYGVPVSNAGWSASDWTATMLEQSRGNHGRTIEGKLVSGWRCRVRDHVRLHILHFTDAAEGKNEGLREWYESQFGSMVPEADAPLQHWSG